MGPIVTYHQLTEGRTASRYALTVRDLEQHLNYLHKQDFECITVDELYRFLAGNGRLSRGRFAAITFDDGYESDYKLALPILRRFGCKATFFIKTDCLGSRGYLNAEQTAALASEGMSIQSHTRSHPFLPALDQNAMIDEMAGSKSALEDITGKTAEFISLPGGRYDRKVIDCARQCGYRAVFSSRPFYLKNHGDLYLVGRTMMKQAAAGDNFKKAFRTDFRIRMRSEILNAAKAVSKTILGDRRYQRMWEKYMRSGEPS